MIDIILYCFLAGVFFLVLFVEWLVNKQINLPMWKVVVFTVSVVLIGAFCGKLMRVIEAGTWTGISYYGALLIAPFPMLAIGYLLKLKPTPTLMMCAPAGCVAVIFMKIQCMIIG